MHCPVRLQNGCQVNISKVVSGIWNFGYEFLAVGGDVWRWLCRHRRQKISAHVDRRHTGEPSVRRPGSEDSHRHELEFIMFFLPMLPEIGSAMETFLTYIAFELCKCLCSVTTILTASENVGSQISLNNFWIVNHGVPCVRLPPYIIYVFSRLIF